MNDPEAEKCLDKAKSALQNGDHKTAERLAQKAKRMFSATNSVKQAAADQIINQAEQKSCHSTASAPQSSNRANLRQRGPSSHSENNDSTTAADYSPEQEAKCQVILRSKCYYKTLGIEKDCTVEEIKKAYRKLALQFHPDKAKCPSAEATFKELSKAYQCLSDADSRRHYDTYGAEEAEIAQQQQQQPCRRHYETHYMTPEELFESFFGVQFARGPHSHQRVYRTRSHHAQQNNPQATAEQRRSMGLFQLFPLIALLLITILSSFLNPSPSPLYSLTRTSEYSVSRFTFEHHLVYYVKPSFSKTYKDNPNNVKELELQIEFQHFFTLCEREQSRLLQQLSSLKFYGTADQYRKKAEEVRQKEQDSANCGSFRTLKSKYPRQANQFYRNTQSVWV